MTIVQKIRVRDPNGVDLTVFELETRRFLRRARRMILDTGELVHEVGGSLVIADTGEQLTRRCLQASTSVPFGWKADISPPCRTNDNALAAQRGSTKKVREKQLDRRIFRSLMTCNPE